MPAIRFKDLQFIEFSGEDLPDHFQYDDADSDLVEFYMNDAKRLQDESIVKVFNAFYNERFVGFVAYTPSEIHFTSLKKEDKLAPFSHPALKIGRLLVCNSVRGCKIGSHILTFVIAKAIKFNEDLPFRFIIVDSLPQSIGFYEKNGFRDSGVKRGRDKDQSLMYIDINQVT